MLKVRLIPTILLMDGRMIKTRQFGTYRDVGNPRTVAKVYDAQRADELIFLDITATTENRHFLFEIITAVALNLFTNYFNHVADPVIDFPQAPAIQ